MFNSQLQRSGCVLDHRVYLEGRRHGIILALLLFKVFSLFSLVLCRLRGIYVSFGCHVIATCANTSSGEVLQTGIPLTSSIRSPLCTEASRSALRIAESNLEKG